ncbi:MAG: DUF3108 domain-containing protein [Pseudomonadota bacterium]
MCKVAVAGGRIWPTNLALSKGTGPRRALISAAVLAAMVVGSPVAEAANGWPSKVSATYRITFNGFDIGTFRFRSKVSARGYTLDGHANISALLGAVKWQGITRSSGKAYRQRPAPKDYVFNFRSGAKSGNIKVGFNKGRVSDVRQNPPLPTKPGEVPLKRGHLSGVLDPLSAVMALTRPASANPCAQRLKIFDGKQRFDLALSFKRQDAIGSNMRIAGQPGIAVVCAVKYQPVAGYAPSAEVERLASGRALEVSLRPVPGAGIHIPHQIKVSTMAGPVALIAQRVEITTDDRQRIGVVSR